MKSTLPLLFIVSITCFANFWEDLFLPEKRHTPIIKRKKTLGSHQEYLLKDEAQLFKIYDNNKKYLGSVIVHKHYISNEHEGNLNHKDAKRFYQIAKIISGKEGYSQINNIKQSKKKNSSDSWIKMNCLYQGETLEQFMDYWAKQ